MFERIQELAAKRDKNLKEVSLELGYSKNYLYTLKTKEPSADKLKSIAKYFGVSTDFLLGIEKEGSEFSTTKPKVKLLARKMDNLDDSQLDALDGLIDNFFDKKFKKGSDEN